MDGVELVVNHTIKEEQLRDVDILFFNRFPPGTSVKELLALRDKYGFKIVADNDDYWDLGSTHTLYDVYKDHGLADWIKDCIHIADHCTVTHERLAERVAEINPNVTILPNAIPQFGQFLAKKEGCAMTRLYWSGSSTHRQDMELLRHPLKRFNFPNIMMVMAGYNKRSDDYRAMASAFTNGARLRHSLIEFLPVDSYYYAYSRCDIALIPLVHSNFNKYKSNLKLLEAANIAAPVIVSRVHPYLDFPEDLVNYVDNSRDWFDHVKMLLNNPDYAKEQGLRLQEYCGRVYNFEKINKHRKDIFYAITGKQREAEEVRKTDNALA